MACQASIIGFHASTTRTCISTVMSERTKVEKSQNSAPFFEFYDKSPEIFEMIQQCMDLVVYFKRAELNSQLEPKLKQEITTHWYGLLTMLYSIRIQYDEVRKLLVAKGGPKEQKIDCIDHDLLVETIRIPTLLKTSTLA